MECKYCGDSCRCAVTNYPPCGFCESHKTCEICGDLMCNYIAIEVHNREDNSSILICPECGEEE